MATKIDVPFTDSSVSASTDGARDFGELAVGAAVLVSALSIGGYMASRGMEMGTGALGIENPDGNSGFEVNF